jgi:transposase-like protein
VNKSRRRYTRLDDAERLAICKAYHAGLGLRAIAKAVGVSVGAAHGVVASVLALRASVPIPGVVDDCDCPRPIGVVFGVKPWDREAEAIEQGDPDCPRCGGEDGSIQPGSRLYCAACGRTGFDRRIGERKMIEAANAAVSE